MNYDEARDKLMLMFPNSTVCATERSWFFKGTGSMKNYYDVSYDFSDISCRTKTANSFEECFLLIEEENAAINKILKKDSILFRQFNLS